MFMFLLRHWANAKVIYYSSKREKLCFKRFLYRIFARLNPWCMNREKKTRTIFSRARENAKHIETANPTWKHKLKCSTSHRILAASFTHVKRQRNTDWPIYRENETTKPNMACDGFTQIAWTIWSATFSAEHVCTRESRSTKTNEMLVLYRDLHTH